VAAAAVVLAPKILGPGLRLVQPISRMKRSQRELEQLVEYHWVARIVYEHWRGELKRAGRYPAAVRAAAGEVETAAGRETDRRVRTRLEGLAAEMRAREPAPPAGFDPATHRLLLSRLDDVEKWSLDDVTSPIPH
jgi:hypothetical protein